MSRHNRHPSTHTHTTPPLGRVSARTLGARNMHRLMRHHGAHVVFVPAAALSSPIGPSICDVCASRPCVALLMSRWALLLVDGRQKRKPVRVRHCGAGSRPPFVPVCLCCSCGVPVGLGVALVMWRWPLVLARRPTVAPVQALTWAVAPWKRRLFWWLASGPCALRWCLRQWPLCCAGRP